MKTYTLKLKTASTTNYSLYDGTTLVSDADLTTLFATEGEAYFTIDLNSLTPTNLTSLTVVNSSDTAVMTNTGLTLVDGKNFKGEWGNSATSFTSFAQLSAYGLDESQLSTLVEKMGEGKVRTIDVSSAAIGSTLINLSTLMQSGEIAILDGKTDAGTKAVCVNPNVGGARTSWNLGYGKKAIAFRVESTALLLKPTSGNARLAMVSFYSAEEIPNSVVNDLTSTVPYYALSANQGRILNNNIGDLTTLTTTDKTSTVAAINELVTSITGIAPLTGNSAPTTSTAGKIGQIYLDTTDDKVYILKSIEEESGQPDVYNWEELGGGGGSYDVFTTNEWNALWS